MKRYFEALGDDEPTFDAERDAALVSLAKGREVVDDEEDAPGNSRPAEPVTRAAPAAAPVSENPAAEKPVSPSVSDPSPAPVASATAAEAGATAQTADPDLMAPASAPAGGARVSNQNRGKPLAAAKKSAEVIIKDPFEELAEAQAAATPVPVPAAAVPAPAFGIAATGAAAGAPAQANSVPPGISTEAVVVHESDKRRALARVFRGSMAAGGVAGILTRGDDPVKFDEPKALHGAAALRAMGFPDRPRTWPSFIAWPPQAIVDRFQAPDVTALQRQEMLAALLELEDRFLARSKQINDWFERHNPLAQQDKHSKTVTTRSGNDPHFGIKWATLINPGVQDRAIAATVLTWGHGLALTADGGALRVHDDVMSFAGKPKGYGALACTPQSMMLAIQEARNRGWNKIELSGSYEFGKIAIKAAKEAGIEATITYQGKGLNSWRTYQVKVMPNPPMPAPRQEPGSTPQADPKAGPKTDPKGKPVGEEGQAKPRNIDDIAFPPLPRTTGPSVTVPAEPGKPVEFQHPATEPPRERERSSPAP